VHQIDFVLVDDVIADGFDALAFREWLTRTAVVKSSDQLVEIQTSSFYALDVLSKFARPVESLLAARFHACDARFADRCFVIPPRHVAVFPDRIDSVVGETGGSHEWDLRLGHSVIDVDNHLSMLESSDRLCSRCVIDARGFAPAASRALVNIQPELGILNRSVLDARGEAPTSPGRARVLEAEWILPSAQRPILNNKKIYEVRDEVDNPILP
jgi:hypothetical protein